MVDELALYSLLPGTDTSLGAFGLLGIAVGDPSEAEVHAALSRQLARLVQHPQGSTAQADEVRLALHVAAAQLRDPRVRKEIVALLQPGGDGAGDSDAALDEMILGLIAHCGGWNDRAKRLVASVLHSYGMGMDELSRIIRRAGRRERAKWDGEARALGEAHPEIGAPAAAVSGRGRIVLGALSAALILATVVLLVKVVTIQRERTAQAGTEIEQVEPDGLGAAMGGIVPRLDSSDSESAEDSVSHGGEQLIARLDVVLRLIQSEPTRAIGEFQRVIDELARTWVDIEREHLVAANERVIRFVRDCSGRGMAGEAVGIVLGAGQNLYAVHLDTIRADDIRAGVWSVGMAYRLERERTIPRSSARLIDSMLSRAVQSRKGEPGRSYWAGASGSLETLAGWMLPGRDGGARRVDRYEEAWEAWIESVRAVNEHQPTEGERVVLHTAGLLLLEGAEPSQDDRAHSVLWLLLDGVTWEEDRPAREAVVAWFDDPGISVGDLAEVTTWIAGRGDGSGVGVDMVLSATAGAGSRQSLRDRYADAWGLRTRRETSVLENRWAEDARRVLDNARGRLDGERALEYAARLSLIAQAAVERWGGAVALGETTLRDGPARVQEALSVHRTQGIIAVDIKGLTMPARGIDGEWGARFQEARRNSADALRSLGELLGRREPLGSGDADVLAEAALFATPADVRQLAQRLVRERAGNPAVVYGLLEACDQMPRSPEIRQMIEEVCGRPLPGSQDPGFRMGARRALVARVWEMLAAQEHAVIDLLSVLLGKAYGARGEMLGSGVQQPTGAGDDPRWGAAREWDAWRGIAQGFEGIGGVRARIEQIERRRAGRVALARGAIQLFAAEQASVVEIMALVVEQENASDGEQIGAIMDRFAGERRVAADVFEQILAGERAVVELWLIRFGDRGVAEQQGGGA